MLIRFLDPAAGAGEPQGGAGGGAPPAGDPARASYPGHSNPPAAAPAATDFATLIPADFKEKSWVKETKDLPSLFKRTDDLVTELGKRPAGVPQENAKPEEWAAFNKAFGVPEKAEDYKFGAPPTGLESSPDFQKGVQKILHEAGVSARQFKAIEPAWNALQLEMAKNMQASAQALDADFDKLAVATFGERKDVALASSKVLIDKFTPEALKPHLGKLSNENLVIMASVLDAVRAKYINEDQIPSGSGNPGSSVDSLEGVRLMSDPAYTNAFDPRHAEVKAKVEAFYAKRK